MSKKNTPRGTNDTQKLLTLKQVIGIVAGAVITSGIAGFFGAVKLSGTAVVTVFADSKRIDVIEKQLENNLVSRTTFDTAVKHINERFDRSDQNDSKLLDLMIKHIGG